MEPKKASEEVAAAAASNSGNIYSSVVMNQYKVPIGPQTIIQSSFNQQSIGSAMNKETSKNESTNIFFIFVIEW